MKKITGLIIIFVLLLMFNNLSAQTVTIDTNQVADSLQTDSLLNQQFTVLPATELSPTDIGNYILNLSRLLFWKEYKDAFVIGVTDSKLEYFLTNYFDGRKIHGLPVKVVLVNANTLPWTNIIFLTKNKRGLISKLESYYRKTQTVIISEVPQDVAYVCFSLVAVKIASGDLIHTYRYNLPRLKAKGIYIMPEIKAYGIR